jgi:hypothetical protein
MKRIFVLLAAACCCLFSLGMAKPSSSGGEIKIVVLPGAHPRVVHGAEQLQGALLGCGKKVSLVIGNCDKAAKNTILVGTAKDGAVFEKALKPYEAKKEGFALICEAKEKVVIAGVDESGALYGCLELIERIESDKGKLPEKLEFYDSPVILLRGPCIGIQRPEIIYDDVMYDYPYLPKTFPWLYDKALWTNYLDLMAKHRSNTLYLWNGHPFTSILRLEKYPEAQEVETEQLEKNIELFKWLCNEADKRGIWVVQFFYNIHLSHTFARAHGIEYTPYVPTELTRDYTSYCITEFIKNYPNVGLMMCLGEQLDDKYDAEWLSDVIIPAVKAGLKPDQANPPIIVRNHSTPLAEVLKKAGPLYDNIYTMAKYTSETLASDKVAGGSGPSWEQRKELAKKYMLIANVHCVCNLEPFRWGSPVFVRHAMQSCEQIGIKGLHLYPLRYWDWPYTADKADPPLLQPDRDWIWYATWARYAWNPNRDENQERTFWIRQIGDRYGSDEAGKYILDAYEFSGDVMPQMVRSVSAEAWNIEAHTMGQTLEQFIYSHPWYSDPEESIALYAKREAAGEQHKGNSPVVATDTMVKNSKAALKAALAAGAYVTKNKQEYELLVNDMRALSLVASFYKHKTDAAISGLMFLDTTNVAYLDRSVAELEKSMQVYRELAAVTKDAYHDCAGHHSPTRLVPFPIEAGLVWSDVVNRFEDELAWVKRNAKIMRDNIALLKADVTNYPVVKVSCPDENNVYRVEKGAMVHTGPTTPLERISAEFVGLNSIRTDKAATSKEAYKVDEAGPTTATSENVYKATFTADEPVRVFVGFALREWTPWYRLPADWKDPEGWIIYAQKAVTILGQDCDVYYRDFPAGTSTIEFKHGPIVVVGFTRPDAPLIPVAKRYYGWQMFTCPMP